MRKDPQRREPRAPAVAVWTATGFFVGLALSIILGSFPLWAIIGAALGLAFGLYTTRTKHVPTDD